MSKRQTGRLTDQHISSGGATGIFGEDAQTHDKFMSSAGTKDELGDELCGWCPLSENLRGVYSVPCGSIAGCEGSHCGQAYEAYYEECAANTMEQNGHIAQQIK
jgi:hypothetical protein